MEEGPGLTPLGRVLGWILVAAMAAWPWVVSYMIAYAPEESGLDFEPDEGVFWWYLVAATVAGLGAWRAGAHGVKAPRLRTRIAAWAGVLLLAASAVHHTAIGGGALLFLSGSFW